MIDRKVTGQAIVTPSCCVRLQQKGASDRSFEQHEDSRSLTNELASILKSVSFPREARMLSGRKSNLPRDERVREGNPGYG